MCKMEDMCDILERFHLQIETYTKIHGEDYEELLNLIKREEYWDNIFRLSADGNQLKEFFESESNETREQYFDFGVSCFFCFVQANFTGPEIPKNVDEFLQSKRFQTIDFASRLSLHNEEININTKYPVLLVISEIIFDSCIVNNLVNLWWCCRALMVHQDILDELSPTLLSNADRLYKLIQAIPLEGNVKAELDIELAQLYIKFRNISKSIEHINSATEILGLNFHLSGKLGKRTKHQLNEIAQLVLNVSFKDKEDIKRPEVEDLTVPINVPIDDDTRLEEIQYSSKVEKVTPLPNTEQKLILTNVQQTLIACPWDELQIEEVSPFISVLLEQNNTFCVRVMALMVRCKLENSNRRTIERCVKQYEEIIKFYNKSEPHPISRIVDVFSTSYPPLWKIEAIFADILLNFGLVKHSLEVYLKIKLWEEVIVCYTILKLKHKAIEVIKQQLAVKPTVKLMCLLGDATEEVKCYETAWEMSKKRSHRVQRHWGSHYYERQKYEECIPHFEKSLSINPLQANIWFRLGFAAQQTENWPTAATAYRRYTTLEPNGFEAWNNLAQAYLKIGNKLSAHQAILEALKCNFENWKVWENLMVISCDVGHYADVIRAYHRVLDLNEKYLNTRVLTALVYHVNFDTNDHEGNPAGKYMQKTSELFGRITSLNPRNGEVWNLYSDLTTDCVVYAHRLQRAYRGYTQSNLNWNKDMDLTLEVLTICIKMAKLTEHFEGTDVVVSSIKSNISSAVAAVRKMNWSIGEHDYTYLEKLADKLDELKIKVEQLEKKIEQANADFVSKSNQEENE